MGNCFNKGRTSSQVSEASSGKSKSGKAFGKSKNGIVFDGEEGEDLEMCQVQNTMPQQPEIDDPIDMALWRLNCMTQLRQEVLDMFTIIEGKV